MIIISQLSHTTGLSVGHKGQGCRLTFMSDFPRDSDKLVVIVGEKVVNVVNFITCFSPFSPLSEGKSNEIEWTKFATGRSKGKMGARAFPSVKIMQLQK